MTATKIEWVKGADGAQGQTWNPIRGCSKISPGCERCYAATFAARFSDEGQPYHRLAKRNPANWTGELLIVEREFMRPIRRKIPTTYFVNSMSDLFHERMPPAVIDLVFAVAARCPQHTFQCLTKRADRMQRYCTDPAVTHRIAQAMDGIEVDIEHDPTERWAKIPGWEAYEASTNGRVRRDGAIISPVLNPLYGRPSLTLWKDNEPTTRYVHFCVLSAFRGPAPEGTEARHRNGNRQDNRLANLQWADGSTNQRDKVRHGSNGGPAKLTREQAAEIRSLRKTGRTQQSIADEFGVSRSLISMIESRAVWPDAIEWPLPNLWLGVSVENQQYADERIPHLLQTPATVRFLSCEPLLGPIDLERADWVIVGGESGRGARPMHPDWARSIRDQCIAADVPFFFKQWGEWLPHNQTQYRGAHFSVKRAKLDDDHLASKVGKKEAGRLLDGRTWDEMPKREEALVDG